MATLAGNKLMTVAVIAQGSTFAPGTPAVLFQTHIANGGSMQQYDIARDERFLINTELGDASTEAIHLPLKWRPPVNEAGRITGQTFPIDGGTLA